MLESNGNGGEEPSLARVLAALERNQSKEETRTNLEESRKRYQKQQGINIQHNHEHFHAKFSLHVTFVEIGHTRPNCPWKNLPSEAAKARAIGRVRVVRAPQPAQQNHGGVPVRGGFQNRGGF
uniref:Uncharacterized protein n=1 Tax=Oryza rufipogon TaxID=4529 RepID=A0A0E0NX38_ORYRU